jgi:hypothetical protein
MARYGGATMDTIGSTKSSLSTPMKEPMKEMSDRRSTGRTKIAKGVLPFFGGSAGVNSCVVHDHKARRRCSAAGAVPRNAGGNFLTTDFHRKSSFIKRPPGRLGINLL